jgi:hypothetical protein
VIFQHTIDNVLNGTKTQTSRIWKDNYTIGAINQYGDTSPNNDIKWVQSLNGSQRMLYRTGQELAVQPKRGAKGIARIKITHLEKRTVDTFTDVDIAREGFVNHAEFLKVWRAMHGNDCLALVIRFELVQP